MQNTTNNNQIKSELNQLEEKLQKRKKQQKIGLIIIILLAILLAWWIRQPAAQNNITLEQPKSEYQAVFLSNDTLYFGKILKQNNAEIILSDIYYFSQNPEKSSSDTLNNVSNTLSDTFSLTKLGSEIHSPTDKMRINRNQVIFIEDLQENSQVVKAILEYKKSKEEN